MADFKDRLWRDLVREHGADLAEIHRSAHRRPRRRVIAAWAAGLAAAGTALLVALGTSSTSPAFAVQRHPDGRLTVTIYRAEGFRGANARLAALGVQVRAVPFVAGCARFHTASPAQALKYVRSRRPAIVSVGIDPRRIHPGKVVVFAARPGEVKPAAVVTELKRGAIPQCVGTIAPAPPLPGDRRVVCHTGDGKTVPFPPKEILRPAPGNSGASGNSGNSGKSGNSGASGNSGRGGPDGRSVTCQVLIPHPGSRGNSGSSGSSGVTGNS